MINNICLAKIQFRTTEQILPEIKDACAANTEITTFHQLGVSEEGRPLYGVSLGKGPVRVSLIAGSHSDEPTGAETLRTLVLEVLKNKNAFASILQKYRFIIVPHINPDGEAINQTWIRQWPGIEACLQHIFREPPGRDLEFGYPGMRQENRLVAKFLQQFAPFSLHISLHGMGFSDGLLLLIEKHWIKRTGALQAAFREIAGNLNFRLHDHDRKGEKGFQYLGPGFTTTPEGQAMRRYFKAQGDEETANLFHHSSMEFVRSLGGDPLCLVTELPLFLINKNAARAKPGIPVAFLEFKKKVREIQRMLINGEDVSVYLAKFQLEPLPLDLQIRIQLQVIDAGLKCLG